MRFMDPTWPPTANERLVVIICKHLLRQFKKYGQPLHNTGWWSRRGERVDRYYDPWWWPLDPGDELGGWGLLASDPDVTEKLTSLCDVNPTSKKYPGFLGSLGASEGCVVVLGERPSFGVMYGNFTSGLKKRLPTLLDLAELRSVVGGEPIFHITDLIKFRGSGFKDKLTKRMICISLSCLRREFEYLKPPVVLLAKTDERPGRSGIDILKRRLGDAASLLNFVYEVLEMRPSWLPWEASPQSKRLSG
jgi:hypothetical protein